MNFPLEIFTKLSSGMPPNFFRSLSEVSIRGSSDNFFSNFCDNIFRIYQNNLQKIFFPENAGGIPKSVVRFPHTEKKSFMKELGKFLEKIQSKSTEENIMVFLIEYQKKIMSTLCSISSEISFLLFSLNIYLVILP